MLILIKVMEIFPFCLFRMPSISTFFVAFLAVSLFMLFLIIGVKTPELWRSFRRFSRQMQARRTRGAKMLADLDQLKADARKLEGVYRFDNPEHKSSVYRNVENSISGPVTSSVPLR